MGKPFLIVVIVATNFWSLLIDQFVRHISDWFVCQRQIPWQYTHMWVCGSVYGSVGEWAGVWAGVVACGSARFLLLLRIFICLAACFLFLFFSASLVNQNSSINWQKLPRRGANVSSCCCRSLSRCCCCGLELIAELANLARGASVEFMFAFLSHANTKQHRGVSSSSRGRWRGVDLDYTTFARLCGFSGLCFVASVWRARAHKIHKLKCSQINTLPSPPFATPPLAWLCQRLLSACPYVNTKWAARVVIALLVVGHASWP